MVVKFKLNDYSIYTFSIPDTMIVSDKVFIIDVKDIVGDDIIDLSSSGGVISVIGGKNNIKSSNGKIDFDTLIFDTGTISGIKVGKNNTNLSNVIIFKKGE